MQELGIGSRVRHTTYGDGVVVNVKSNVYSITFINEGRKEISREHNVLEIIEAVAPPDDLISNAEIERTLIGILQRWTEMPEHVSLGSKWTGGKLILQPGDTKMASKEMPIDTFFHKIVMLRDRLRVMEQRINAHDKFSDEDKINMQQYITRIYGSLTSFNVLFKFPHDQFVGEKGKE
jgi:predicted nuclease of restriction endonuclease-like RecB superfamily